MKYLVLLVVLVLAYGWWRSQRRTQMRNEAHAAARQATRPLPAPQDMVACARCGVHVPRAEALTQDASHYCCAEHRPTHAG